MLVGMTGIAGFVGSAGDVTKWNSADKSADITLSNGDRTFANTVASFRGVRDTLSIPDYKCYFEFLIDNLTPIIGVANSSESLASYCGATTNSWGWQVAGGSKVYHNAANAAYTGAGDAVAGDRINIAIDMVAQKFWGGRNGTWHNSGDPGAGTGNAPFPTTAIASSGLLLMGSGNANRTFATFQTTATDAVPTGFKFIAGG